jgi:general secretion pathway protein G
MKSAPRSFSSTGKISRSALIAGAILAAVTAATAVVVAHEGGGDERASAVDAGRRVLAAAQAWQTANSEGCPTITQLVEDGQLEKSERTDDPWGNRYRIVCDGTHAVVRSAGPDKHPGTPDDVTITRDES